MIKILTADNVWLDVLDKTEISFQENSKFFDSNIFQFDFSSTVDLPFSPNNNLFFANLTDGKALVSIFSDGIFIDKYYLKLLSKKENIAKNTGSYNVEFNSIYDTINDEFGKKYLSDLVQYEDVIAFPNMNAISPEDTTLLDWLANEQLNPRNVPYRFPQYSLIKDIDGETSIAETLNKNFGNIVECNFFDWQSPHPGYGNTREFYYHRGVVYNGYYPNGDKNNHNMLDFPIMPWSIAVPCFNYIWVMREALKTMGYELQIEYKSKDIEDKLNNKIIPNNYNILNFRSTAERQIKEEKYMTGAVVQNITTTYTKLIIWDWIPKFIINAKNHLPKVTISDLILDFVIKTGCELTIDGAVVKLSVFDLNEIENKNLDVEPNIERKFNNVLNNTILKYDYKEDNNQDNIPNYEIKGNSDNSNEVTAIFCPIFQKKNTVDYGSGNIAVIMSYIIGSPNIDAQLSESIQRRTKYNYIRRDNNPNLEYVGFLFEEENIVTFVTTNQLDPYCAFSWRKSGSKNVNFLLKREQSPFTLYVSYKLQAFDFIEDFSLHW